VAVIRVNYVKKGKGERQTAKANIRYIQYRRGKDGQQISRTLFGVGGEMERLQAYAMVNQAEEGSTFFRIKICPDPNKEDMKQDLLLREITEKTMAIEDHIGKPIAWVAAIHDDHTDKRHVHVLAVTKARLLPAPAMIQMATQACREQRLDLDYAREQIQAREQEGDEWERER
jgi:hypothetical protein